VWFAYQFRLLKWFDVIMFANLLVCVAELRKDQNEARLSESED
jgi:hypothetical protein